MALVALMIAFALPFILVKSFPNKHKANYDVGSLAAIIPSEIPAVPPLESLHAQAFTLPSNKRAHAIPSSVPLHSKTAPVAAIKKPAPAPKEELITVKTRSGDSLATVFNRLRFSPQTLQTILRDNPRTKAFSKLKTNEQLQFVIKNHVLEKLTLPISPTQYMVITRNGTHYKSTINSYKTTTHNHYITATVRGSLYNTAKRSNVPYKLIQQMTEIFAWDINFAKEVRDGDQFTIIYKAFFIEDRVVGTGEIVALSYRNRGKTYQAVLHTNRAGHSNYYNPQGVSLKNAFNRYPVRFSHISSTFSLSRYHPILHYKRAHRGVDLAAPIGTPIFATGDGAIELIGRQSGYGNMIKIKHSQNYSSIYGHMLRFQKGLSRGSFVKRGQVIGYVGQTGLASGPHCHYEFHINHQPKNPTTVALPRGEAIPAREMASFRANASTLLAQLKLYEKGDKTRVG
jgi:murein DD-endopeptidase MepM/ murein hydrolase activator NlpD